MTQTIVVTEFLSLDGVMEAPNEWNIPYVDETLGADIQGELDRATALLPKSFQMVAEGGFSEAVDRHRMAVPARQRRDPSATKLPPSARGSLVSGALTARTHESGRPGSNRRRPAWGIYYVRTRADVIGCSRSMRRASSTRGRPNAATRYTVPRPRCATVSTTTATVCWTRAPRAAAGYTA